ncbi:acetyltransferase domain-containing protein [Moniliophthora roreri MCA 2997]|uniref:Acetyltransferase domain-containing protein n=1 Tax=Moniliophthora roreri (strain MCA 2997) TaxID=1381753 RepID=V2WRX1_MONRO|nr:acetyltransferase domain-containing protein [Moniliophthora roreri MCA 2997]
METELNVTVRVFCPADFEDVKTLFSIGIVGSGSPGRSTFFLSYTHIYSIIAYLSLTFGLRCILYGSSTGHYAGMMVIGLAVAYLLWIYAEIHQFYEGYRLASLAGDLRDIPGYYRLQRSVTGEYIPVSASCFWVAEVPSPQSGGGRKVVGCVALDSLPEDAASAELRRLSVLPGFRRRGVGSLMLRTLLSHASQLHLRNVRVTTTNFQMNAVRLYARHGWIAQPMKPIRIIGILTFGHVEMELCLGLHDQSQLEQNA